jgi:cytochrome P450
MPLPRYISARKKIARLDHIVYGIISKRKQGGTFSPDLLQLLLETRDEDTGEGMSDLQLRDEVMTIFLAGHETTVNALSWTWYLLEQHPDEKRQLFEESSALPQGPISFETQAALRYGKNVMNESMRLYPPVYAIGRKLIDDDTIGGYAVTKKNRLLINITGLHHHPGYWPRPHSFEPQRFDNFDSRGDNRFLFIPFGGGPRICIGNNFAMMEMLIINALLSRHAEMELQSFNIQPVPQVTLKPGSGVMMKIKKVKI